MKKKVPIRSKVDFTPESPSNEETQTTSIAPDSVVVDEDPVPVSVESAPYVAPVDRAATPQAPRRSQRTAAQKPPGFYKSLNAQSTSAESVRDYVACRMSANECASMYGKEAQLAAGEEEVINIIGREALIPRDYRKLTKDDWGRVLSSFIFYKAKELLPSEAEADTPKQTWTTVQSKRSMRKQKNTHKIKGRWVGGGNRQKLHEALRDRVAPTARSTTHAMVFAIAAKEKRPLHVGDIPSAYLQAKHVPADGRTTFVRADKEVTALIVKVYPDLANYVMPNGTMILEVAKALYGLVESAWLWYHELADTLQTMGYRIAEADRGLFVKQITDGDKVVASNIVSVHVDDLISAASQ